MKKVSWLLLLFALTTGISRAQYCIPDYTAGTTDNDFIDGFELNTIGNLGSGGGDGSGYSDFTALTTTLIVGNTYDLHIINTPDFGESYRAWVDYDHDLVFASDEELFIGFNLPAGEEIFVPFTVPLSAMPGSTQLRIRCVYGGLDFDACGTETYGEAEDYTVNILGLDNDLSILSVTDIPDACDLSDSEPISVTIKNFGTENASGFSVSFSIDGGTPVTEPVAGTLPAGNTYIYNFDAPGDLSSEGPHDIVSWVNYDADELAINDTNNTIVINTSTYITTGFPENICYGGGTVFPSPIAGGGTWSGDGIVNPLTGELDPSIVGGVGSSTDITYTFITEGEYTVTEIPFAPYFLASPDDLDLGDDAYIDNIDIGFNFTFFGNEYDHLFVSSNGLIGFSAGSNSYNNQHFPDPVNPNNIIALCWTDLNPDAGGDIKYEIQGTIPFRRFIVEYDEVTHYGGAGTITGQIVLYETSNAIDFHITEIEDDGGDITQGIENIDGTIAYVTDELYNQNPFSMVEKGWRFAVTPCDAIVTETINFVTPPVVELDDEAVCTGTTVTLDAGPGAENYIWSTGESTQTINVAESGNYWVIYYSNIACYTTDTSEIIVNPLPIIDLGDNGVVCEGTMLDAENIGAEYLWNTGAISQTLFVTETGTYYVDVINPLTACANSDTINLTITPLPVATFTSEPLGPLTLGFTNTSTDVLTTYWDFGDGAVSYELNPWHEYPFANTWDVTLVVTNDCGADIEAGSFQVTTALNELKNENTVLLFPNPTSEFLNIELKNREKSVAVYIYTLQGQLLFQQNINHQTNLITLDIEHLAVGNYMVVLQQEHNTTSLPLIKIK